jgi:hypothetical protein
MHSLAEPVLLYVVLVELNPAVRMIVHLCCSAEVWFTAGELSML